MSEFENLCKNLNLFFKCLAVVVSISFCYQFIFDGGKDRTDSPSRWGMRSGLMWHLDHETGCQYLSTPKGFLIPRMDKLGNHVCGEVRT